MHTCSQSPVLIYESAVPTVEVEARLGTDKDTVWITVQFRQ